MGPLPRALMTACLSVLRWLLLATAALMAILIIVQHYRGDEGADPLTLGIGAVAMALCGWACGRAGAWFARMG